MGKPLNIQEVIDKAPFFVIGDIYGFVEKHVYRALEINESVPERLWVIKHISDVTNGVICETHIPMNKNGYIISSRLEEDMINLEAQRIAEQQLELFHGY